MAGTLRVLTYNVHGLRDDASAVAQVLRGSGADVVALQEPPRTPGGRRRLEQVASEAGYVPAVCGGGARTTALLVRRGLPVIGARAMRLGWRPGRARRGVAYAEVGGIRVISLHLGLSAAERARHLVRVVHLVRATTASGCVVAGDLNEEPGGPSWLRLQLHLRDVSPVGPTYPSQRPRQRIDVVLATSDLVASRARVLDGDVARRASDHLPVVVDVRPV